MQGSQFGMIPPPSSEMAPFSSPVVGAVTHRSCMVGIPPVEPLLHDQLVPQAHELTPELAGPTNPGNFPEDDSPASAGNRWPRQETLALLKIRSEMDEDFKNATLKAPLWDEVSRKLAEVGYKRNAKKCKEKFENVHKYYKRTKDGRQDGKAYRFFTQLDALNSTSQQITNSSTHNLTAPTTMQPSASLLQSIFHRDVNPTGLQAVAAAAAGLCFSSDSSSEDEGEFDDEGTEGRKRKRGEDEEGEGGIGFGSKKMMAFFDGLMTKLMERQETMQNNFLETIEKREQERTAREEAWRRQEMARLSREQELLAQERASAASRDAALISYLQRISSEREMKTSTTAASLSKPQPPVAVQPLQQQQPPENQQSQLVVATEAIAVSEGQEGVVGLSFETVASSRWPKAEVHALIDIRSRLDSRYQEVGPKGPLWEEISGEMQKLGYSRNAKRCKEKWENINKYFKKVKESSKKRPEDAKTCPYFHQLDALYRRKQLGFVGEARTQQATENGPRTAAQQQVVSGGNDGNNGEGNGENGSNNDGVAPSFYEEGMKKPEDIMKGQMQQQSGIRNEEDSDSKDRNYSDDYDDDEDDEDNKMQYKIQYQSPNVNGNGGGNVSKAAAPTANAGSFLAIVQ